MRLLLVAFFVLTLCTVNEIEASRHWQRFKNIHGCTMVPREGTTPRSYQCGSAPCADADDCSRKLGDSP